jgi:hypothetical protein
MAHTLLYQGVHRIYLQPLRAPAEGAVGGRVAPSNDVDPKGFFHERLQQVGVDIQVVLLGTLPHAGLLTVGSSLDGEGMACWNA